MALTNHNIAMSAALCEVIYSLPEGPKWKKVPWLGPHTLSVKSTPLHRNLIGKAGTVEVALFKEDDTCYICYSGTEDKEFWIYNTDTACLHYKGYRFHRGFFTLANEIYKDVHRDIKDFIAGASKVVHCGHSSGGAVAGIMPLLLAKPQEHLIVDFGTPRYLSSPCPKLPSGGLYPYNRMRFQEIYDLVPCLPLSWRGPLPGFCHFGKVFYTTPKGTVTSKKSWWRPVVFAWKYLHSLATEGPIYEIGRHHSIHNYFSTVVSHVS